MKTLESRADLHLLLELVTRLRAPDGCPWDRKQRLEDVRTYLLEEAHETAAAIDEGDWNELAGELGDLLFQVAFIGTLAHEAGAFSLGEVISRVHEKMVARHPHVFGGDELADAREVEEAWERRKVAERGEGHSLLTGVAPSLPALAAAYRLTQKAGAVGFDWPDAAAVLGKLEEELAELRQAVAEAGGEDGSAGADREADAVGERARASVREEVGDLLFTAVNLARKLDVDPEAALAAANLKFRRRFARVEEGLRARGTNVAEASLEEMDEMWEEAKR